jgi:hypothetical protein
MSAGDRIALSLFTAVVIGGPILLAAWPLG